MDINEVKAMLRELSRYRNLAKFSGALSEHYQSDTNEIKLETCHCSRLKIRPVWIRSLCSCCFCGQRNTKYYIWGSGYQNVYVFSQRDAYFRRYFHPECLATTNEALRDKSKEYLDLFRQLYECVSSIRREQSEMSFI